MTKAKNILLWTASVICGIVTLCGFSMLPQTAGFLFCIIPTILLNPLFIRLLAKNKLKISKAITIPLSLLPLITIIIFITVFSTPTANSQSLAVSSAKSAYSQSSLTSASNKTVSKATSSTATVSSASTKNKQAATPTKNVANGKKIKIYYLDVGQGDSEFIEFPNGKCMLIDAGVPERGAGVVSYIKNLGHKTIDYIICTHPHSDHIGGMTAVVNSFSIGSIYMPRTSSSDTPTTKVYTNLLSAIKAKGLKINAAKAGITIINSGAISAKLIAPNSSNYNDLNQYSAVLMLQYGNKKFLFMGDAGNVSEAEITADVKADVLKVGHHGSNTATGAEFLNKVSPKYAIIEVGAGNSYGHPTSQTLGRLSSVGAAVYRTDKCGTIIATSDGSSVSFNKTATSISKSAAANSSTTKKNTVSTKKNSTTATKSSTSKKATAAANSNSNNSETVYITDTGKSYHTAGCGSLRKSKHAISLKDAKARGYSPCKKCHPPQ